jgi:hypothetical protein
MRKEIIDKILELSGDELQAKTDLIDLAIATEEELISRLMDLLDYYVEYYNS